MVSSESQDSLRTDLGFRAYCDLKLGGITLSPFLRAAWEHEFNYSSLPVSARLADIPGAPTTVFGPTLGADSAVVNAGLSVQWTKTLSTYVSYDGQLGRSRYNSNGVSGGFSYAF